MPNKKIVRALITFVRRETYGEYRSCEYESAMHLVDISGKYTKSEIEDLAYKLVEQQIGRWGENVLWLREVDAVIVDEREISDEKYKAIADYLDSFDSVLYIENWRAMYYKDIPDVMRFVTSKHIVIHLIFCGTMGRAKGTDMTFLNLIDVENPCKGEAGCKENLKRPVGTDVQSLYVLKSAEEFDVRCPLFKRGGWRLEKPKWINLNKKKKEGEVKEKQIKEYPNPLEGKRIVPNPSPGILDTLQFCYKYGLNPIPLAYGYKRPIFSYDYERDEPIKDNHLQMFSRRYINIGVSPTYNNVVLVDNDTGEYFDWDTTTIKGRRGYNYIFFTDEPFHQKFEFNGKEVVVMNKRYIVLPPSIHPETKKPYKWVKKIEPKFIKAEELRRLIENEINHLQHSHSPL